MRKAAAQLGHVQKDRQALYFGLQSPLMLSIGLVVSAIFSLMTFGSDYRWSRRRIAGIFALVAVPYITLWSWIKNKVELSQLQRQASREKRWAECSP